MIVGGPSAFREVLAGILEDEGHVVCALSNATEAEEYLRTQPIPEVLVLDVDGHGTGTEGLFTAIKPTQVRVVILSSENDAPERAESLGFAGGLVKPIEIPALMSLLASSPDVMQPPVVD